MTTSEHLRRPRAATLRGLAVLGAATFLTLAAAAPGRADAPRSAGPAVASGPVRSAAARLPVVRRVAVRPPVYAVPEYRYAPRLFASLLILGVGY